MRTVTYRLADLQRASISIGFVGENEYTRVQFDALKVFEEYPSAIPTLSVVNPAGTAYPVVVTHDGDYVIWDVQDSDLVVQGRGEAQLTFTSDGVVVKSYVFRTVIDRSIVANGETPDPVQNWIDEANSVLAEVEEAIPAGGTTGQVLAKKTNADRDLEWVDQSGGGGGTSDYNDLSNKPQIAGTTLSGNKSLADLGIASASDIPDVSGKADKTGTVLETTLSRGRKANTTVGRGSFAFGNNVEASNEYAHAEGSSTIATGANSHAEGSSTWVDSANFRTTASGAGSHAEGLGTTASGDGSHSEGGVTKATGSRSHAEGSMAEANGTHSHAEGENTIAQQRAQHVFGKYNVKDTQTTQTAYGTYGTYAEIVGNGTPVSNSNARTLDWNGNERLKGKLYVECNADSTGGSEVAKKSDIPDVSGFYTVPSGGIPSTDMSSDVQTSLGKADSAYQKPGTGIPATDLASGVIPAVHNVPSGGSSGQVLAKASGTDYDLQWVNQSGGGSITVDDELSGTSTNPVQNKVITEEVASLMEAIANGNGGKETFGSYGQFVNGNLASGVVYTNVKYRVTTNTIMTFTRALTVTVADGFRFLWHTFVNGSYSSNSDWKTGTVTIPANSSIKVLIARVTEDETEVADINTFLSKVTFNTVVQNEIDDLTASVTSLDTEIDQKTDFVEFVTDPNFEDTTNIAADTTWQEGYYRSTAGNATSSQYTTNYICSDFIPVNPGEKYRLYVNGTATVLIEYYSNAKNDGTEVSLGSIAASGHVDVTVPDGKTFIALNCLMNHSNRVNVIHRLTQYDNEKSICFPRLVYGTQQWIGKKIVNFGDSIFDNGQETNEDISTHLAQWTGATVYNCAFGGCRMGYHTSAAFDAFSMYKLADAVATGTWTEQDAALEDSSIPVNFATTLARLKAIDFSEVDIITISYGTNDFAGGLGLGGDSKYFTDWALKYSIETILTAYPNVRIFVCLPIYRVWLSGGTFDQDSNEKEVTTWTGGDTPHKLTDFVEAERTVCKGAQIPVIDNYYELGINKWNWTTYIPSSDGTHPNTTGRDLIAEHIAHCIW